MNLYKAKTELDEYYVVAENISQVYDKVNKKEVEDLEEWVKENPDELETEDLQEALDIGPGEIYSIELIGDKELLS